MDVKGFADALLTGLATADLFESVALQTEGPIASATASRVGSGGRHVSYECTSTELNRHHSICTH